MDVEGVEDQGGEGLKLSNIVQINKIKANFYNTRSGECTQGHTSATYIRE